MPPLPPLIVPLLVSVVIVPEFETPAAARADGAGRIAGPPAPPVILPLLASDAIVPAFANARAARAAREQSRCRRCRR